MKRALFIALVLINAGLLVTLLIGADTTRTAQAQEYVGQDYMMVAGHIDSDTEVLYITDLRKNRLVALEYDEGRNVLVPYRGIRLLREFGREQ